MVFVSPPLGVKLLFSLFGIGLFAYELYCLSKNVLAKRWPTTDGKITSIRNWLGGGSRFGQSYNIDLQYTYAVSGTTYTGTTISFQTNRGRYSTSILARRVLDKYPVGAKVQVYVNPANPQDSLLEPGMSWLNLTFGIAILLGFQIFWLV